MAYGSMLLTNALGVLGILHLWLVSFEGVSHARYYVRVAVGEVHPGESVPAG
jgi:hypothetical protein